MVEPTIDKIKDITVERQIRKLAGVIDEQNQKIEAYGDATTDIDNLKASDANQNTEINKLKATSSAHTTDIDNLKASDVNQNTQINNLKQSVETNNETIESAITDINNLKESDANQTTQINNLKQSVETNKQDIESVTTDINELKASDTNQTTQINNLKQSVATDKLATESAITALQNKDTEQDGTLNNHAILIQGITESLVSGVQVMSGTTTGDIKIRLERESAAVIDSNDYNLGLPVSAEIIQGTGPSMFKIQITMSSGVKVISNDFVFTTEAIGNDVYISSFTFKAGNQVGYLSADIGLNNGVTIEANNFLVPTDPNVTSAITDLQSRVSTTENEITELNNLKTTVNNHTSTINTLNNDVADLTTDKADVNNSTQVITAGTINATNINKGGVAVATVNNIPDISGKADLNNTSQTIVAGTINATNINKNGVSVATVNDIPSVPDISGKADLNNSSQTIVAGTINATNINKNGVAVATTSDIPDISGKVDKAQGTANAGKVLGINASGNVEPIEISSGGEVWEEVDLSNFPTNWLEGERIKIQMSCYLDSTVTSWSSIATNLSIKNTTTYSPILEIRVDYYNESLFKASFGTKSVALMNIKDIRAAYLNSSNLFKIKCAEFNGGGCATLDFQVTRANIKDYVKRIWRLKK